MTQTTPLSASNGFFARVFHRWVMNTYLVFATLKQDLYFLLTL
jgi:hypothetical protein